MKYLVEIVFLLLVASPVAIGLERSETGVVVEQKSGIDVNDRNSRRFLPSKGSKGGGSKGTKNGGSKDKGGFLTRYHNYISIYGEDGSQGNGSDKAGSKGKGSDKAGSKGYVSGKGGKMGYGGGKGVNKGYGGGNGGSKGGKS